MKYFFDTEFLEGKQEITFGKPTIDLISIGIISEKDDKYYAISKEFNLNEAWDRYQIDGYDRPTQTLSLPIKNYWLRDNVLMPILKELEDVDAGNKNLLGLDAIPTVGYKWAHFVQKALMKIGIAYHCNTKGECTKEFGCCDKNLGKYWWRIGPNHKKRLKNLLEKYGKTNDQIAKEIKSFVDNTTVDYRLSKSSGHNNSMERPISKSKSLELYPPKFYAYFADYDWVVFCWLFGKMIDLPKRFPMYCIDLKQELDNKLKVTNIESKLWGLLDDIDTASDIFKPDNKSKYVKYIYSKLKHHELLHSDGYDIVSKYRNLDEIKALEDYPKQTNEHNALADAKWNKRLYNFLENL